ncbi:MAG: hypothetical protein ACNI3A_14060 [Desulfovibrio sp.]|uniref:hypothetical protein n=1 Tax=Desulfovibrio sp. 7SRBS1 TaxID=3378064 RepID=UPI003B4089B3
MSQTSLAAGESIVCRCTKCGDERKHTIVAMVDGSIAKVQCDTCQGVHKYRSASDAKKTTTKRTGTTRTTKAAKQAAEAAQLHKEWENLTTETAEGKPLTYSMSVELSKGSLVEHPIFGVGSVRKTIYPDKAEILFEAGMKVLRCKTV